MSIEMKYSGEVFEAVQNTHSRCFQRYFSSLLYLIPFYIWSICSKRVFVF